MARKGGGSTGTPATRALAGAGIPHVLRTYPHDVRATSYGLEAAEALGVEPARVFKTLLADVDGALVVGIVPVDTQLDLKALAAAVGGKRAAREHDTVLVSGGRRGLDVELAPDALVALTRARLAPIARRA